MIKNIIELLKVKKHHSDRSEVMQMSMIFNGIMDSQLL